jgi:hypothetical protein
MTRCCHYTFGGLRRNTPSTSDGRNDDSQLVVGVYVDDLVITGSDHDDIKLFKEEMTDTFEMSYLDIEVK